MNMANFGRRPLKALKRHSGDHRVLVSTDIALFTIKDGIFQVLLIGGAFLLS